DLISDSTVTRPCYVERPVPQCQVRSRKLGNTARRSPMARLVVYGSSVPCPDMARFQWWLQRHEVGAITFVDIHREEWAYDRVVEWTGHASVPTLVIASDDGLGPVEPPRALEGRRARAFDRGTMLTEPNVGQIAEFLRRHGIEVTERTPTPEG